LKGGTDHCDRYPKTKKRRDGEGAAHEIRGRERLAKRAAAKAAEKTAKEAKGDVDSDNMMNL
jgi:hypothetical protein